MYEKCKSCFYNEALDVCIRCFNYSSYKPVYNPLKLDTIITSYTPLKENPLYQWPKKNPYLENLCKVGDDVGTEDLRDKFKEIIDKRVKEIKERENMKDFTIDEITTTYEDGEYKFEITCRSTKPVFDYINNTDELARRLIKDILNRRYGINAGYGITRTWANPVPTIKDVRFNGPATIVFWEDGTKTVVKAVDEDVDYEKGLAMAIAKKALGNKGNYFNEFKKWLPEGYEPEATIIDFEKFKVKFKSFEEATRAILEMTKKEDEDKQKKEKKKVSSRKKKDKNNGC